MKGDLCHEDGAAPVVQVGCHLGQQNIEPALHMAQVPGIVLPQLHGAPALDLHAVLVIMCAYHCKMSSLWMQACACIRLHFPTWYALT